MADTTSGTVACDHSHLLQPEWGHAEHGAFTVLLTCKSCRATTVIDLGDITTQEWNVPQDWAPSGEQGRSDG